MKTIPGFERIAPQLTVKLSLTTLYVIPFPRENEKREKRLFLIITETELPAISLMRKPP